MYLSDKETKRKHGREMFLASACRGFNTPSGGRRLYSVAVRTPQKTKSVNSDGSICGSAVMKNLRF